MALPLIESGKHDVHLLAAKHTSFAECYCSFGHWFEAGNLNQLIKLHAKDTDIFHCHNEPSWFVTMIKENCDVPVILDVHDSFLARCRPEDKGKQLSNGTYPIRISVEERNNFQLADGLVFPGHYFAELICKEFGLAQPSIVLESFVPRRLFRYSLQDWFGGLVYQGKIQLETNGRISNGFKYCDYNELATKCKELGIPFHVYGGRDDEKFMNVYSETAIPHEPVVYDVLLRNIARHDWGLVGNIFPSFEWDNAMPNKLFEYMSAGVPVVAINAKESEEFVVKHGVGISVKSIEELKERWDEHKEIRRNLIKKRVEFSMEKNIHKLEELYSKLKRNS